MRTRTRPPPRLNNTVGLLVMREARPRHRPGQMRSRRARPPALEVGGCRASSRATRATIILRLACAGGCLARHTRRPVSATPCTCRHGCAAERREARLRAVRARALAHGPRASVVNVGVQLASSRTCRERGEMAAAEGRTCARKSRPRRRPLYGGAALWRLAATSVTEVIVPEERAREDFCGTSRPGRRLIVADRTSSSSTSVMNYSPRTRRLLGPVDPRAGLDALPGLRRCR